MRPVLAIARLTFWEGIRMKIILVFVLLLVFLVLYFPFTLSGDGTLAGRLQNFLGYGLGAVSLMLGLSTIFLSCSTLATEYRDRSIHLVVTKPVSRLQILLGKWIGVNLLNVLLLALCGVAIFYFATMIKNLPEQFQRDRVKLSDTVWTARLAAKPNPPDFAAMAREMVDGMIQQRTLRPELRDQAISDKTLEIKAAWREISKGEQRIFDFEKLPPARDSQESLQVRFKVLGNPVPPDEILKIIWGFLDPESRALLSPPVETNERSGDRHEFLVRAQPVIRNGKVTMIVENPIIPGIELSQTRLIFDGENSLQILYRVGSFEANYLKTVVIIFLRLLFLSAVGLFFSVFVSYPVACLCTFTFFVMCIGMPFWMESIGANLTVAMPSADPYGRLGPAIRSLFVPLLRFLFPDFTYYDGTTNLIDGIYISPALIGQCALHTICFGALLLLLPGWLIFQRREIAEVQV